MKFRNKLIIIVGLTIILSFSFLAFFISNKITDSVKSMSVNLAVSHASNSSDIVSNEIEKNVYLAKVLHDLVSSYLNNDILSKSIIYDTLSTNILSTDEHCGSWLVQLLDYDNENLGSDMHSFYYRRQDSIMILDSLNNHHLSFFKSMSSKSGMRISEPYVSERGDCVISILFPIINNNKLRGLWGFDVDLLRFQKHFYDNKALGRAYVSLVSSGGICISHPDETKIGLPINVDYSYDNKIDGNYIKEEVYSKFLQLNVLRIYKPISVGKQKVDWMLVSSIPLLNVHEVVSDIINWVALIGFTSLFLLMLFLFFSQKKWNKEWVKRKKAEFARRDITNKLYAILESSDKIFFFAIDSNGSYTAFNSFHKKEMMKSESVDISIGDDYLEAFDNDFKIEIQDNISKALSGEYILVEYERDYKFYQHVFNPIIDDNFKIIGVSCMRFDISETVDLRKKAVSEKQARIQAQLKNLKNRVNPHFLFNSLNSLYSLVDDEPKLAREFVIRLSKVYRYLLDSNQKNLVDLSSELEFTKHYFFLQKIRFGESILCDFNIDEQVHKTCVPPSSVQSLVENAIKHNIVSVSKPLRISIFVKNGRLFVENNYQLRTTMDSSDCSGTGLLNLSSQYKFLNAPPIAYGVFDGVFRVEIPLL